MRIPPQGNDFFAEALKNVKKLAHPDDLAMVLPFFEKKNLLKNLKSSNRFSFTYRLVVNEETMHVRCSQFSSSDNKHILVCLENINDEVRARAAFEESKKKSAIYSQVVSGLVSRYETVYYVNAGNGEYSKYSSDPNKESADDIPSGKDFFVESVKLTNTDVHPEDKDRILAVIDKDYMISALENRKQYSADYRRVIGGRIIYTRLKVMRSDDNIHFIVALENINEEVRKERDQIEALNRANELARRDSLTGVRNSTAYREFEEAIQKSIEERTKNSPFAIVVCDVNDLKYINDFKGHSAGDEYIRSASRMICGVFAHSPVFRIGGDEFAAVLAGGDFDNRVSLVDMLKNRSLENLVRKSGPVVAVGIAVFDILNDRNVTDVFNRADNCMYENKTALKSGKPPRDAFVHEEKREQIPSGRKRQLDGLFGTISIVSSESYAYICDIRYDYSRWSKELVDSFGLSSEYMYGAKKEWEEHIHPEDIDVYRENLADLFAGISNKHEQQFRIRRINGEYSVCTCKGIVLRDENGKPEYLIAAIRDHGVQSDTDSLTGLRNQYGFFEEIHADIIKSKSLRICMIGIARFSEINEIYGYNFGNLVLQKFGWYLYNHIGNDGTVFRLDGTKFAILTSTLSPESLRAKYNDLRSRYREGLNIDGKHIMLEFNAGMIDMNDFNVDAQTVMACLNLAYSESKTRRHGDAVEFNSDLNNGNRQRLETLHAIRASITMGYRGFYLMYQPVVDVRTERTIGAEALLRWKDDEYGAVPPDLFISLLEQDPLFPELGEWILYTAVTSAKQILKTEPAFVMNVNLSYTQLEKPGFVDMVTGVLENTGYPPGNLCLEITERCRLIDIALLKNIVVRLRSYGVRIALDDFGTGFSSVSIVRTLPFNIIKIDRSFIASIEADEKEQALIRAFVDMATTYGALVCIEGVETSGMRDILRGYDVHSFQGYYFAAPLEFDEFLEFVGKNRSKEPLITE